MSCLCATTNSSVNRLVCLCLCLCVCVYLCVCVSEFNMNLCGGGVLDAAAPLHRRHGTRALSTLGRRLSFSIALRGSALWGLAASCRVGAHFRWPIAPPFAPLRHREIVYVRPHEDAPQRHWPFIQSPKGSRLSKRFNRVPLSGFKCSQLLRVGVRRHRRWLLLPLMPLISSDNTATIVCVGRSSRSRFKGWWKRIGDLHVSSTSICINPKRVYLSRVHAPRGKQRAAPNLFRRRIRLSFRVQHILHLLSNSVQFPYGRIGAFDAWLKGLILNSRILACLCING